MKGQSRRGSLIETAINIAVGFLFALGLQYVVFPHFGIHTGHADNLKIAGIFTVASIIRGYLLRRGFNAAHKRGYFMER